jgi:hypothetical protein
MTDKYRRIILFLIMIVVVVIIVDLVFNFRGIFMENYERYVKSQENFIDKSTDNEVKSIISKVSGKIINVDYVSNKDSNQTCKILFSGQALTAGSTGTVELTEFTDTKNQLFEIILVDSDSKFKELLGISDVGNAADSYGAKLGSGCTKMPFHVLRNVGMPDRCLHYDSGKVTIRPIANYDSIKFDVSFKPYDQSKFVNTHNTSDLFDVFSNDLKIDNENKQSLGNPNAIKINLKLNNEVLSNMFGLEEGFTNVQEGFTNVQEGFTNVQEGFEDAPKNTKVKAKDVTYEESAKNRSDYMKLDNNYCKKNYIKRDALKSLCPGCKI